MIALGYITAALTLVLILITAIYATANWRTVRLMEADLRFRTQPIPTAQLEVAVTQPSQRLLFFLSVWTSSAPLRIEMVHVHMRFEKGVSLSTLFPSLRGKYLAVGEMTTAQDTFDPTQGAFVDSHVILTYQDLAGLFRYQSTFMLDGRVTTTAYPMNTAPIFRGLWTKIEAAYRAVAKLGDV
jgi:hypothetical protein